MFHNNNNKCYSTTNIMTNYVATRSNLPIYSNSNKMHKTYTILYT